MARKYMEIVSRLPDDGGVAERPLDHETHFFVCGERHVVVREHGKLQPTNTGLPGPFDGPKQ